MYNKCEYSKSNNNVLISPKHYNFSKKDNLPNSKNKKEMDFYSNFTRTSKSPLNLYSKHKITYSKHQLPYSPRLSRTNRPPLILTKNLSQTNIYSPRPVSSKIFFPTLSKVNNNNNNKNLGNSIEIGKLRREIYEIKKIIKNLTNDLFSLKQESICKDKQIELNDKQIDYILSGNSANNPKENSNAENYNIITKIKKEIKNNNVDIKRENDKLKKLKRSLNVTKLSELNIEKTLFENHIEKINNLIQNAKNLEERNNNQMNEKLQLEKNILNQEELIKNLINQSNEFNKEEIFLTNKLNEKKNNLNKKLKLININIAEIAKLKIKKDNLSNKKINKEHNNQKLLNEFYKGEISKLKKQISSFKFSYKVSENRLSALRSRTKGILIKKDNFKKWKSEENEKKEVDLAADKEKIIKLENSYNNSKNIERNLEKKLNLYLNKLKEIESNIEENNNNYNQNNLTNENNENNEKNENNENNEKNENNENNENKNNDNKNNENQNNDNQNNDNQENENNINNENPNDENINNNQIEFGIDCNNPYYSEDEGNMPEITNKFTSTQFNQFTYVLFKTFESKNITNENAMNIIINPFLTLSQNHNISNVEYNSDNFNFIIEEFTKIIMQVLNNDNKYNFIMIKIFLSALLYNSECKVIKLIEYFNILFSYTRSYDENKFISVLRSKYKEQMKKLVICISDYVLKEAKSEVYLPLLKVKDLLDENEIIFKDKYIEFLFYYMKKYDDPKAKLSDLKFGLIYDIMSLNDINNDNKLKNNNKNSIDLNKDNLNNNKKNINKDNINNINNDNINNDNNNNINNDNNKDINNNINNNDNMNNNENKVNNNENNNNNNIIIHNNSNNDNREQKTNIGNEEEIKQINNQVSVNNVENPTKKRENNADQSTQNIIQNQQNIPPKKKAITDNQNSDNDSENFGEDDEDSMTEISNEDYLKQLTEAIYIIQKGIKDKKITFNDLMSNMIQKRKMGGKFYECITIEDFYEQLKSVNINLTDLKLSCLCSKYSVPNELRLIDKNKIEKDIDAQAKGILNLLEEENTN